jgi:hypothetical protein
VKRLVLALLLAGCAQQDRPVTATPEQLPVAEQPITLTCEPFKTDSAPLKRMTKSRDDWKRYAESLERLPSTIPSNRPSNDP